MPGGITGSCAGACHRAGRRPGPLAADVRRERPPRAVHPFPRLCRESAGWIGCRVDWIASRRRPLYLDGGLLAEGDLWMRHRVQWAVILVGTLALAVLGSPGA